MNRTHPLRRRGATLVIGALLALASQAAAAAAGAVTADSAPAARVMEKLGRGVVAVRATEQSVFVSWRLLGLDAANLGFDVYRSAHGAAPVKLNGAPLMGGTNFTDTTADLAVPNTYTVRRAGTPAIEPGASFTLAANHAIEPIVRVPLAALPGAGWRTKYVWVGDLDGDGEYDFVLDRIAPFTEGNDDYAIAPQKLEAYKRDGTRLWQIDLGPGSLKTYNISPGPATLSMGMYDGVTVYDLDGDGKAEVILKVADGVTFGDGSTFTDPNPSQQYVAVLNGLTGMPLATRPFPTDFAAAGPLGTQLGIGYPDGIHPSIYFWGRNRNPDKSFNDVFAAWSWHGGSTVAQNWVLPMPAGDARQASHQMRVIDVDGDGRDEMATGNFMVNSDGTLRYILPGVVHGDRFFIGKFDTTSSGMQGYGVQQNNPSGLLEYYYDATNGTIGWTHGIADGVLRDVGRGLVGDVDPRYPGFEVWSFSGLFNGPTDTLTEPDTNLRPYPTHSIWWDGDVLTEGLNDYKIEKWNPLAPTRTNATPRLLTMSSAAYGSPKLWDHNPMFFGDILGDWRTEVVLVNPTYTELVIFTTDIPTDTRLYTMAHNPAYRNHMTIKGYMQSGLPDYYLGAGMSAPPRPNIRYAGSGAIQAEDAALSGSAVVAANRDGYRGPGFVDIPAAGGTARFTHVDGGDGGIRLVKIRYANGAPLPRIGVLEVNGKPWPIAFPPSGGANTWATLPVPVALAAGRNNTLTLRATAGALASIDEVLVP
ncbi:hypothetical protein IP92_01643 [Pseudoduganella flava]|uniref:CBM6 domain-containing protein n=1 Tax=Pseudoduganella flava TaxID=871742 RepID=A0A562Q177_9BURK|nr:hypothetical protein [Pseudoduganella flava]QGZ38075.1 hypothetical protein GO485_02770 [Pseudoduganella flava]TWI50414.1 hypothetical protein IP92_01643 [Pseudoduganella flava]